MGKLQDVRVPDIGDFKDVPVIELLARVGEAVAAEASLLVLESDKATLEVPAPFAGVVRELCVEVGARVSQGSLVARVEAADTSSPSTHEDPREVASASPAAVAAPAPPVVVAPPVPPSVQAPADAPLPPRASPGVRRLARQLGVDLHHVTPTGRGMRTLREDVENHVKQQLQRAPSVAGALPATPQVDHSKFGSIERRPMSRLRKLSGENLARNWMAIPHVTNFAEADVTELEDFRRRINEEQRAAGIKVTMTVLVVHACSRLLPRFPELTSSVDGDTLIYKDYCHLGFAADTPNGLVVPVIRDADKKSLLELAKEAAELAALARSSRLKPHDMQGGCFSISSLGGIGGTHFTPIINAPEVAILGVGRMQERLARAGKRIVDRAIVPLSLSWDHRALDGAMAASFLAELCAVLSDYRRSAL